MSEPAPPPGFTEDVSHTLSDAQAPAPVDDSRTEFFRSTVEHMLNAGATRADLDAFAKSQGVNPSELDGFTPEVFARVKAGNKIPVSLHTAQSQDQSAPPPGFTEEVPIEKPAPNRSLTDNINLGLTAIDKGLNAPFDLIAGAGNALANAALGTDLSTHPYSDSIDENVARFGGPVPETDAEKLASATIQGMAPAIPLGLSGLVPVAVEAVAGGGSGLAGEAARQSGAGPIGQLGASLIGGIAGGGSIAGIGKAVGALGERAPNALASAFERQEVPALPADVGGHATRMLTAGTSKLTLGGIPIEAAAQRSIQAARAARDRIAGGIGTVRDNLGAGQAAQSGARQAIEQTGKTASHLYEAIPIAGDRPAVLSNTKQALSDLNAGLESNPALSKLVSDNRLQSYEAALAGRTTNVPTGLLDASGAPITRPIQQGGNLSWQDLKAFRSYVGELAGRPTMQDSTAKNALQRLYASLSEDMRATAKADGPKSLAAFERANTYYRARQDRIDNVLTNLLGKHGDLNGENAFRQIESWSTNNGDVFKLARALRSLPEEEAQSVRATIFSRLGTVSKGRQGVEGDTFSPSDFMTHWNGLSSRAKSVLFPGAEYRQSIDDLVRIADAQKTAARLAQGSPTAHLLQGAQVAGRIGGFAINLFSNPLAALAVMSDVGGELAIGKLLSSPRFARWLASAPAKPNAAAQLAHINRLTAIAAAQPAIANDVLNLQERLAQAFAQTPTRAAASAGGQPGQEKSDGGPPPPADANPEQQFEAAHGGAQ